MRGARVAFARFGDGGEEGAVGGLVAAALLPADTAAGGRTTMIEGVIAMKGKILGFNEVDGVGAISADDGTRFRFVRDDWRGEKPPVAGAVVDFEAADGTARDIYPVRGSAASLPNVDLGALAASPGAGRVGAVRVANERRNVPVDEGVDDLRRCVD